MLYTVRQDGLAATSENFECPDDGTDYSSAQFRSFKDALRYLNRWVSEDASRVFASIEFKNSMPIDTEFFIGSTGFSITTK